LITYLKGKLKYVSQETLILEVNNVGYQIFISAFTLSHLPEEGNTIEIYTHMNVREDNISLFGFLTIEELNCFNMLINVSGIGPKVALSILSAIRPKDINKAIITEDINTLTTVPGIGRKTAQRIILDLKDKLKIESVLDYNDTEIYSETETPTKQEAIEALMSLGYSQLDSASSVKSVYNDNLKLEDIIKLALKKLAR